MLGTPLYMAPEQVLTMPVDERADIYAAGVVLYEMLAGRTPFHGESIGEVFAAVLRDEVPPLRSIRPELPASLEHLVHRAMARQPEARFQTAYTMRAALLSAIQELVALGPVPALEALETPREGVYEAHLETVETHFEVLTAELEEVDLDLEAEEWFALEYTERSSGERVKGTPARALAARSK
ncbi:MAG: protein kinase [Myxococcales bacterium]